MRVLGVDEVDDGLNGLAWAGALLLVDVVRDCEVEGKVRLCERASACADCQCVSAVFCSNLMSVYIYVHVIAHIARR